MSNIRAYTNRPPANRRWEATHRWGAQIGDSTDYCVTRTAGGSMTIRIGSNSLEIRGDMVKTVAEMVAKASAWNDEQETGQ